MTHTPRQQSFAAPIISIGLLVTGGIMGLTNLVKMHEANNSSNNAPVQPLASQQTAQQPSTNYSQMPTPQAGPASSGFSSGQQAIQQSSGSH
jgi:hypothetical protein